MRSRWWVTPFLAAAVIGLAACGGSSSSSSPPASAPSAPASAAAPAAAATPGVSATGLKTMTTTVGTVLTTAEGFPVYWFAIDTPTKSKCTGTCLTYWPPVIGTPSLASGVKLSGAWGTIKRPDGQIQATYDGHPLYTYKGDTAAGQVTGNGLNASGGLWWVMTPSGAKLAAAPAPASSPSSSGGGAYGY
jgi:predicted lipoprotein with Yx(FWY)xxD motif